MYCEVHISFVAPAIVETYDLKSCHKVSSFDYPRFALRAGATAGVSEEANREIPMDGVCCKHVGKDE